MSRKNNIRIIAGALLCIFAFFYCGNTLFMHSHIDVYGHIVTHSHPYAPSAHHSHSAASFDAISAINAAIQQVITSSIAAAPMPDALFSILIVAAFATTAVGSLTLRRLRAPPCAESPIA